MMNLLGTLLAFVIVFFLVTFVHEFGHFFMAKLFGVRVDAFSFGIGPRLFGVKNRKFSFFQEPQGPGTDYRVSLVPVICYVKLLGEGMFEKDRPLAPDDLMAKTRGQRFLIMGMGSFMNILLAVALVAVINIAGTSVPEYLDERPVIGWIESGSPAEKAGLRIDDEIVRVAGREVATWTDVQVAVGSNPDRRIGIEVRRDGQTLNVDLLTESVTEYKMGYAGFQAKILTQIRMVVPGSPAEKAGLKGGDVIQAIDGRPVYFYQFLEVVQKSAGRELAFTVERAGRSLTIPVTPRREGDVGKIGISQVPKSSVRKYSLFPAIGASLKENLGNVTLVVRVIRGLFTGETPASQLGGPVAIADFSYAALRLGLLPLLGWIAVLSLQLGVINLVLPIPVADGFQMAVLTLEALFRKDIGPKFRMVLMSIGWILMIMLTAFVILNDFVKKLPRGWRSVVPF
ncbi:MAG TPA: site-2 protease family protein [Candidatus Aminicenantes bacterium]|nr:site-2 protease family protein [Candidatus Aminicenantes bacterium]HRY66261.1 site-2 protease family protein [Candidatus Aminicenantes bacterium]HRZ73175.1 site-2 protease family protein [Candidatus Aminicenantes bacterium]